MDGTDVEKVAIVSEQAGSKQAGSKQAGSKQAGPEPASNGDSVSGTPRAVRWLYALAGLVCVGLAALGAMLPGLPTTIFLMAASYLFTRSCPVLERVLIRNRFFAPFLGYLDGTVAMPRRTRIVTLLIMWVSVTVSTIILAGNESVARWIVPLPAIAACVGSWFIMRFGRRSGSCESRSPREAVTPT